LLHDDFFSPDGNEKPYEENGSFLLKNKSDLRSSLFFNKNSRFQKSL
jgi:hypothetical protein